MASSKIKLLWYSHFLCQSGFATVAENILRHLIDSGRFDITVLAINYHGEPYDMAKWPVKVIPAVWFAKQHIEQYNDVNGRQRLLDQLGTGEFDILFTLQDPTVIEAISDPILETRKMLLKNGTKPFKWIWYYPCEGTMREQWVKTIAKCDVPVAFSNYGKIEFKKNNSILEPEVIYHGTDIETFHPLPLAEKRQAKELIMGGALKGKYVITNVNQNQWRKDLPRTLRVFKEFQKLVPNSVLYLHTLYNRNGHDLVRMALDLGLEIQKDVIFPLNMGEEGYLVEAMNAIYNVSDVVISTTHGEGWGLSCTEAMACKVPVVMPDNTSLSEICDGRGIKAHMSGDMVNYGGDDLNIWRPTVNIESMVNKMKELHDMPRGALKMADVAYDWVTELTWKKIVEDKWLPLLEKTYASIPGKIDLSQIGRNDPCICGSGKKFKKCCGK